MTVCLAAYLLLEARSLGRHLPGYICPQKVTDSCGVTSGSTDVLHFAAPLFNVIIYTSIAVKSQCKINPACKQVLV